MKRITGILLFMLSLIAPANLRAQDQPFLLSGSLPAGTSRQKAEGSLPPRGLPQARNDDHHKRNLALLMALDHVAMTVDIWTTRRAIHYGAAEADPRWKWASHSDWMYLDAQIEPAILDIFWLKAKRDRSKAILFGITAGVVAVHIYNSVHNYHLGTQLAEAQFQSAANRRFALRPVLRSPARSGTAGGRPMGSGGQASVEAWRRALGR